MYCRAELPNAGLANKLFPWARCRVFSLEHGIPMLAPWWPQLKLGPLLRGERDWRLYTDLFARGVPGQVMGPRRLWLRLWAPQVPEPADLHHAPSSGMPGAVVVFAGGDGFFQPLTGWHAVLQRELRAMTRRRWLLGADRVGEVRIGVHVRRGDFAVASAAEEFRWRGLLQTPLSWFVDGLRAIRARTGHLVPATVVSDAPNSELRELLDEARVSRVDTGSAIGDLLVLSRAKLLLGSGGSSFSAWAAFLGQMPAVTYPGQSLDWFKLVPTHGQFIGVWQSGRALPDVLDAQLRGLLAA